MVTITTTKEVFSRMRVTGTVAGRADAIGSVIARRLDRNLLVEES
jgi:hypothetical protein